MVNDDKDGRQPAHAINEFVGMLGFCLFYFVLEERRKYQEQGNDQERDHCCFY